MKNPNPNWGQFHIRELRKGIRTALQSGNHRALVIAAGAAVDFLNRRLTDAARVGCHHCDEGEPGTPCWWCGLKSNKQV